MSKKNIKHQESDQALPTGPFSYRQITQEASKAQDEVSLRSEEEVMIASLKNYPPFQLLVQWIERQAVDLDKMIDVPIETMSEAEIGKRLIVARFGSEKLRSVINYVDQLSAAIGETEPKGQNNAEQPSEELQ